MCLLFCLHALLSFVVYRKKRFRGAYACKSTGQYSSEVEKMLQYYTECGLEPEQCDLFSSSNLTIALMPILAKLQAFEKEVFRSLSLTLDDDNIPQTLFKFSL